MDVVQRIQAFNAGRDPERLRLKYQAMRSGAFSFFRGSAHLFYERLPRGGVLKSAPLVWSCGDLHLENFGSFKADNRLVYFDINDFDEGALAPAGWDLVRMVSSLRVAADNVTVRKSEAERLCALFVDSYATALGLGKAYWVERDTAEGLVRSLLDGLKTRRRAAFLNARDAIERTGSTVAERDGIKALPVSEAAARRRRRFHGRATRRPNPSRTSTRCSTWRAALQAPAVSASTAT